MSNDEIDATIDQVLSLYRRFGQEDYIGEPVSQIEHMCQCAQMAGAAGFDNEVVLAAFFHDIGHLLEHVMPAGQMDEFGAMDHEKLGATYLLEKGFSVKVARLVASHVAAKRYLTFTEPGYYDRLSEASKRTLQFQGGVMTEAEAAVFESDPLHPVYIHLRRWDEAAKIGQVPLPSLDQYATRMRTNLAENQ